MALGEPWLARVRHRLWLEREKRRLAGCYTAMHDNLDPATHIDAALAWLCAAQDHGDDAGFAYGTRFGQGFLASYPETTGYIIPTFLRLAKLRAQPELIDRAIAAGDWEIELQLASGAVMGGRADEAPTPALFNTGQVLFGWASLLQETGEARYAEAGRRAADWMLSLQEPSGNWIQGNSSFARADSTLYNVRAAWGLARFGQVSGHAADVSGGCRFASFALTQQHDNGWYAGNCLDTPDAPLTHTIAYTMRGMWELGALSGTEAYCRSAERCAEGLLTAIDDEGFLPGRIDRDFKGVANWCCLTGSVQTAIVLFKLARETGRQDFAEAALSLNRYVMARHDLGHPDPAVRGGLAGSWPIWGPYGQFHILNWATKFLLDALLEEQDYFAFTAQADTAQTHLPHSAHG